MSKKIIALALAVFLLLVIGDMFVFAGNTCAMHLQVPRGLSC